MFVLNATVALLVTAADATDCTVVSTLDTGVLADTRLSHGEGTRGSDEGLTSASC